MRRLEGIDKGEGGGLNAIISALKVHGLNASQILNNVAKVLSYFLPNSLTKGTLMKFHAEN